MTIVDKTNPTKATVIQVENQAENKVKDVKDTVLEKVEEIKEKAIVQVAKVDTKITQVKEQIIAQTETIKDSAREQKIEVEHQLDEIKAQFIEAKEQLESDTHATKQGMQKQLHQLKCGFLKRLENLKDLKTQDLLELKTFVKSEVSAVVSDLSSMGKELKCDMSEISIKHKEHLTQTLKRSKEHTLAAWHKAAPEKSSTTE